MKKRAFVRYSKQGKIVPGSLILTSGSHPSGPSTWNEVPADLCCSIHPISFNLRTGETQNPSISFGSPHPFPWTSGNGSIYLEIGCAADDPNTEWSSIYIPGRPANIMELVSILNSKASYLGTWELSKTDSDILILNTDSKVASAMCPSYLPDNLVFIINES